jgi:hypothetical protein
MPMPPRATTPAPRRMPLRHKLMLALACEILLVGFRQADRGPARAGILIESPVLPHHAIA